MRSWQRWGIAVYFAAAMAWVEAAAVLYLRGNPALIAAHRLNVVPEAIGLGTVELVREAATLAMLLAVGWLAGPTSRSRWGYTLVAFGAWDILYYAFLVPISGWPRSVFDWDLLFLIPLPWWGPVLAPCLISVSMICCGTLISQWDEPARPVQPGRRSLAYCGLGIALVLAVFMTDALRSILHGAPLPSAPPVWFNWPLFVVALVLMSMPGVDVGRQILQHRACDQDTSPIDTGAQPRRSQPTPAATRSVTAGTGATGAGCCT